MKKWAVSTSCITAPGDGVDDGDLAQLSVDLRSSVALCNTSGLLLLTGGLLVRARGANPPSRAAHPLRATARLGWNVGQPDHILTNPIASHKAERRPGPGEIRLAVT